MSKARKEKACNEDSDLTPEQKSYLRLFKSQYPNFDLPEEAEQPYKRTPTQEKMAGDMALQHLGIIASRCLFWYKFLSQSVRNYYDIDDMISDVSEFVIRHAHNYDCDKAKQSTFIWHTTDNKCKTILSHFNCQKIASYQTVELSPAISRSYRDFNYESERFRYAVDAVEHVIEFSSDALLDVIEAFFDDSISERCFSKQLLQEFKKLADKHSASLEDFILVRKYI